MFKTNSDYQKKLLKRWAPFLEKGMPIESVEKKLIVAQVLENTRKLFTKKGLFTEAAPSNVSNIDAREPAYTAPVQGKGVLTKDDYILPNVVMPMLRRIFPTLMAHELVGVVPMTNSTGTVFALRNVAQNRGFNGYELGYGYKGRMNQSAFTGSREICSPDCTQSAAQNGLCTGHKVPFGDSTGFASLSDVSKFLGQGNPWQVAGHGVPTGAGEGWRKMGQPGGYANGYDLDGTGTAPNVDPTFGNFRNNTYPQATIKFEKRFVVAETRKLGSEFTPEDVEDLENNNGFDLETELVNLISYQLGAEIDQQIKESMLRACANDAKTIDVSALDGLDQMGRIAAMLTFVTREANEISIKTRRGAGNFVLASTTVCSCLQQLGTSKLVSDGKTMPSVPASAIGAMTKEGLINDGRQLLVRDTNTFGSYAMVGYKGTTAGDSGIIYCPYIPVTLYRAVKPENGINVIGARTRYGLVDNPYDASCFYSLVWFTGFDKEYTLGQGTRTFFGEIAPTESTSYNYRGGLVH